MKRSHSLQFKLKQDVPQSLFFFLQRMALSPGRMSIMCIMCHKPLSSCSTCNVSLSLMRLNALKTHRFAPLHLEGEICWRDLIQLPSHTVGEAMQEGIIMEGSFGWVVVGDHKALETGWFVITTQTRRLQGTSAALDTFGEDKSRVEST